MRMIREIAKFPINLQSCVRLLVYSPTNNIKTF